MRIAGMEKSGSKSFFGSQFKPPDSDHGNTNWLGAITHAGVSEIPLEIRQFSQSQTDTRS